MYTKLNLNMARRNPRDHSLFIKAFRSYLQFVNSGMYFKKEHVLGLENVPVNGTPTIIVSNHQNCLNDPLCVCLQLTDRRMNFLARANVFNNPIFNKALRAMGLLPAYRMGYEGLAHVRKNSETFEDAGNALLDGETVMLYPEGGHQDKRWLGTFKLGYLRIAFAAAEKMNFKEDIMILPSCNHYSNYFHARTEMLIRFGKPISLKPYYERYQEEPRATMMEINKIVHSEIKEMMLHIEDIEHYAQIDWLRENEYGKKYAVEHGFKKNYLPSRLLSDQHLVNALQKASEEQPEEMEKIYSDVAILQDGIKSLNIRDWLFRYNPGIGALLLRGLGLIALLPLFIISIIPTACLFIVPGIFLKKMFKDQMFISTFRVAVSALVTVPVCLGVPFALLWIFVGFWWALGYFIAFPLMFILAWNYIRLFMKFLGTFNFVSRKNKKKIKELRRLRYDIFKRLDAVLA